LQQELHAGETSQINRRIAGLLMVIKKSTWDENIAHEGYLHPSLLSSGRGI
jgi:hypothetical protein